ncbi:transcriptional regulator (plasmid) [Ralstonia solanacearum]|nr:transcriptional regulator [Ralstonia solanacearum]
MAGLHCKNLHVCSVLSGNRGLSPAGSLGERRMRISAADRLSSGASSFSCARTGDRKRHAAGSRNLSFRGMQMA